ncbi:MAG: 2Fe-2S iron-sulfur cluster binding domain-containing protein [Gammaproteobacteria bacterium]|jgi:2Fe-2S ferredoxin|nr:2Fe-2S iron-sulfur cluster binding domain-containing protein [Gammaproteobacteria bacterium]MBT5542558.1 2Fe-2S iron-sulfur cluster binding domain-containing protein [Gammaproteobacteria bacterium]MBT7753471.1 2Fe-2S iron-sulfur cluster binding domain-containing protein [Gammaproteobacteria bacterium]
MALIHVIDSEGEEHEVEGQVGLSLMESLRDLDNGTLALCGGMCSCATCHCFIEEPWASSLSERQDDEHELLEDLDSFRENQSRLSCQIELTEEMDGMRVEVAPDE